ncbi:MAG: lysoplasmalogenase family protein [Brevefilum sp.]
MAFDWKKVKPFSKVLAIVSVIAWTVIAFDRRFDRLILVLLGAQIFGMAGDIFLLFSEKYFIHGLTSFLVGHFLYASLLISKMWEFSKQGGGVEGFFRCFFFAALTWVCFLFVFYSIFYVLPKRKLVKSSLWTAIQGYGWVLSGLVAVAFFAANAFGFFSSLLWLMPVGAFLFLLSDLILAYNRFIKPVRSGPVWVHMTYHSAQFFLAAGFVALLKTPVITR